MVPSKFHLLVGSNESTKKIGKEYHVFYSLDYFKNELDALDVKQKILIPFTPKPLLAFVQ